MHGETLPLGHACVWFLEMLYCVCLGHGVILLLFLFSLAVSVYVEAYDNLLSGPVAQYTALSQKIGGDVQKHVRNAAVSLQFLNTGTR